MKVKVSAVTQPLTLVLFLTPQFPCRNCGEPTGRTGSVFPSSGSLVCLPFAWIAEIIRKKCFEFQNWFKTFWSLKVYQVSSQGRRIVSNFGGPIIKGPYLIGFFVCFWETQGAGRVNLILTCFGEEKISWLPSTGCLTLKCVFWFGSERK